MKQPKKLPPKVVELLKELAPPERAELLERMKVSRATYFRWLNEPGAIGIEQAEEIRAFLQDAFARPLSLTELWGLSGRLFTKPRRRALVA